MATYALVPGADGAAWYWHRVVPGLRAHGHEVVTLDLPSDPSSDLDDFADAITAAIDAAAGPGPLIVVGQSLGGFSAPLVCARRTVDRLVLLNAMVPRPGETAGEWWDNTGQPEARERFAFDSGRRGADAAFDLRTDFFHDVPAEITEEALAADPGGPPPGVFQQPWPLAQWPDVPTRLLQGRDDRFFPFPFQQRIALTRLALTPEPLPGGHLLALSHPTPLLTALLHDA